MRHNTDTTSQDEYYLKQPELVRECLWALKNIVLQTNPCITHRRMYQIPFFFYKDVKIAFLWVKQIKILCQIAIYWQVDKN
jgi:hypothetical protein